MITYKSLVLRPNHFYRLTGHTSEEFIYILDKFKSAYEEKVRERRFDPKRKRAYGAGRPPHLLTLEDKLLFILVYVRMYPLLFLHGMMFNLSESNACFWVHEYLPILDKALGYAHKKPLRPKGRNLEQLITEFPELAELGILGDGIERPTRKPKNKNHRKSWYSGKKKCHTRKNILLARPDNQEVLYLSQTRDGSIHDKKAIEEEKLSLNRRKTPVPLGLDLGFERLNISGFKPILPNKKPKGKELSEIGKSQNKTLSQIRVKVENAICGVKRSHAIADVYRNITDGMDDLLMSIACGLHNVRVAYRYQKV
jgi:hypothetical protein